MKYLELMIDDSLYQKIRDFLELLPQDKVKLYEKTEIEEISYIDDSEQSEIEVLLENEDTRIIQKSKTIIL
jgi:hypothetical protein